MKKTLLIFFALCGFIAAAKADTIDFWHVYYNADKIREFNDYGRNEIVLKRDSIKASDSITVKYFRDTPCEDCKTYLSVEDGKHHVILLANGLGTFNPVSFLLGNLIAYGKDNYEIFYFEGEIKSRADKELLFRIKLE